MKATVKVNMRMPRILTQEYLEKIMTRVIRPDIESRMTKGISISGTAHKPNTKETLINKGLRGLKTDVPLIASGQLRSSFRINLIGNDKVVMYPAGERKPYPPIKSKYRLKKKSKTVTRPNMLNNNELADILQNQGVKGGHKYEFFGISKQAEQKSMAMMVKFIEEAIKRA